MRLAVKHTTPVGYRIGKLSHFKALRAGNLSITRLGQDVGDFAVVFGRSLFSTSGSGGVYAAGEPVFKASAANAAAAPGEALAHHQELRALQQAVPAFAGSPFKLFKSET